MSSDSYGNNDASIPWAAAGQGHRKQSGQSFANHLRTGQGVSQRMVSEKRCPVMPQPEHTFCYFYGRWEDLWSLARLKTK